MNFIAHYYFEENNVNPYFNLGLVMPDLVRIFLKGKHIFPSRIDSSTLSDNINQINEGSKIHMEQDKVFHNSTYFHKMMDFSKSSFKNNGVNELIPKSWFLAHIALELILDRHLIKNLDGIVEEFYSSIEATDRVDIKLFLEIHAVENIPKFMEKWDLFISERYLFKYVLDDQLVFALNKVYQRAGIIGDWNPDQKAALVRCFNDIERETARNMDLLKKELSLPAL